MSAAAICKVCGQLGDRATMVGVGPLAAPVHVGACFDRWLDRQIGMVRRIMERGHRRQGKR